MSSKQISPQKWTELKRDPELKSNLSIVERLAKDIKRQGGQAYLVGGFVRDLLRGKKSKDIDLEVYGLTLKELENLLKNSKFKIQNSKFVGKSFGVFKIGAIDVALARRDSKTAPGQGRKPRVEHDATLTLDQASRRRDLTINALYLDPLTLDVLDPQHGLRDLKAKALRYVDAERFGDDPLRVLRLMQFAGRFGFKVHSDTIALSRKISLAHLSKERVGEEWKKLLLKSSKPSLGLKVAKELGILKQLHSGLDRMSAQDWKSALASLDRAARLDNRFLSFVGLCYWLKQQTKIKKFFAEVDMPKSTQASVLALIGGVRALNTRISDYDLRKAAYVLKQTDASLGDVVGLARALGFSSLSNRIVLRAKRLGILDSAPESLIQGRDLIKLGLKPGPHFAQLLRRSMEAQWRGEIKSKREALESVRLACG